MFAEVVMTTAMKKIWMLCAGMLIVNFGSAASAGGDLKAPETGAAGKSGYHLLKKMKLGGPGGWDYLTMDFAGRRLFVSHATHG